jgi:four helix bundle protein
MGPEDLKQRTKRFALRVIRLAQVLPKTRVGDVISRQLLRAGTSVGANYRAACRAQSPADFVAKMHIVQEEADESLYWMELLTEADLVPRARLENLAKEAEELVAIVVASIRTVKTRNRRLRAAQSEIRNPKSEMA